MFPVTYPLFPSGLQSEVSAIVQGIEMEFVPAPLHRIHVVSSIATVFFTVVFTQSSQLLGLTLSWALTLQGVKLTLFLTWSMSPSPSLRIMLCVTQSCWLPVHLRSRTHKLSQEVNRADSFIASVYSGQELPSSKEVVGNGPTEPETPPETSLTAPPTREPFITAQR